MDADKATDIELALFEKAQAEEERAEAAKVCIEDELYDLTVAEVYNQLHQYRDELQGDMRRFADDRISELNELIPGIASVFVAGRSNQNG